LWIEKIVIASSTHPLTQVRDSVMSRDFTLPKYGYRVKINNVAKQADGSAWLQQGGTVLLATVVSAPARDFPGFLPLSVDYREQFSAAGKIPGGYFKREGRLTDKEVLTSRIIDRAIRPLFPKDYFEQVQLIVTVYSVDKEHTLSTIAALASSLALSVSKVPFMGPVGFTEIGRLDGQWVVNPSYEQSLESDVKMIVAGTKEGVCMVEGSTNELSEAECIDALFLAHATIKEIVAWQEEIIAEVVPATKETTKLVVDWATWEKNASDYLTFDRIKDIFGRGKKERTQFIDELKEEYFTLHQEVLASIEGSKKVVEYIFNEQFEEQVTALICEGGKRIDNRSFDQIRKIVTEVGILPFTHGSALFTRGNTQSLATLTLGSGQDEQRIEDIMGGEVDGSFMLHYNFPPFSVGEVRPLRAPSRREVGHGHLAASAFKYILPDKESFPYTIRIVSDILECDGSSSMATVCSSTMAFLNGGVPIKDMVGGVAMGLLKSKKSDFTVLSDITGFEDAFGLMDFKVAGTEKGITAIQMDIKYKGGLLREVFEKALAQARQGRLYIISQMKEVMSKPNENLSDLVPQVITFKINTDKIGAVIGSGGKVIRQIIEATGTTIDIESDGTVKIFGQPGAGTDLAVMWVKTLAGQIKKGSFYDGIVRRTAEFGLFVEIVPGKDGLVHISTIPREKQQGLDKNYPVGMKCKVEVIEYDAELDRVRLRIV